MSNPLGFLRERARKRPRVPRHFAPRASELDPLRREGWAYAAKMILEISRKNPRNRQIFSNFESGIAKILGWAEDLVSELLPLRHAIVRRALQRRMLDLTAPEMPEHPVLGKNLALLGLKLGLSDAEAAILRLSVVIELSHTLRTVADSVTATLGRDQAEFVAMLVNQPVAAIEPALRHDALLFKTGLLEHSQYSRDCTDFKDRFALLEGLAAQLVESDLEGSILKVPYVLPMRAATVGLTQYPHLKAPIELIGEVLRAALKARTAGVNILLHGPPGTGKTELARALIAAVGGVGMEIKTEDEGKDQQGGNRRLRTYAMTQRLLAESTNQVVLFDESEGVLAADSDMALVMFGASHSLDPQKGWKISQLESNPAPAIWTCNTLWRVDPALQRRFTYCLEVPVPPRSVRLSILNRIDCGMAEAPPLLGKLADNDRLTPADVERVDRVLKLCPPANGQEWRDRVLLTLGARPNGVDTTAMLSARKTCEMRYEPAWINASPSVAEVGARLQATGEGRLCFAGPPGTGKTAFARHLAQQLDRPLVSKKASDLMSAWVGGTEAKIAEAFKEVRRDNGVLLIDEADTFLQDRRAATRSWEISQVNEMLKQLEEHAGYVILSTNLFDHLDPAVLRRLDVKVTFGYLAAQHVPEVFTAAANALGVKALPITPAEWAELNDLALGDVAVAMRQVQLTGTATPRALFGALREQLACRSRLQGRRIGF